MSDDDQPSHHASEPILEFAEPVPLPDRDMRAGSSLPLGSALLPDARVVARLVRDERSYEIEVEVSEPGSDGFWNRTRFERLAWPGDPFVRPARDVDHVRGCFGDLVAVPPRDWRSGTLHVEVGQLDRDAERVVAETEAGEYPAQVDPVTGMYLVVLRLGESTSFLLTAYDADGSVSGQVGDDPWNYYDASVSSYVVELELVPAHEFDQHVDRWASNDGERARAQESFHRGETAMVRGRSHVTIAWPDGRTMELGGAVSDPTLVSLLPAVPRSLADACSYAVELVLDDDGGYLDVLGVRGSWDAMQTPVLRPSEELRELLCSQGMQ